MKVFLQNKHISVATSRLAAIVGILIPALLDQGYHFVTVSELLGEG